MTICLSSGEVPLYGLVHDAYVNASDNSADVIQYNTSLNPPYGSDNKRWAVQFPSSITNHYLSQYVLLYNSNDIVHAIVCILLGKCVSKDPLNKCSWRIVDV